MSPREQKKQENQSLGYPLIEEMLETEDFKRVNQSFSASFQKLERIFHDHASGIKKQKEARKAMEAYEYTVELVKELLKLKYQVEEEQKKNQKK